MKRKTVSTAVLLVTVIPWCMALAMGSSLYADEMPSWLQEKRGEVKKAPPGNPPVEVYRCTWQDRIVYYLPPQCCDKYSDLYDDEGTMICHPGGGVTGMGDGKCKGFSLTRDKCMLIWKDDRPCR